MKLQRVRGTQDFLPEQSRNYRFVEQTAHKWAEKFNYGEVQTPLFEFTEVFHRTMGETSDVIHKETYSFKDRGGDDITLRPEGTAGIARAFISEGLAQSLPLKIYYSGAMFRYERPQKGRYRQFHQIGAEALGYENPQADVEILSFAWAFLKDLGLHQSCHLEINTLGDKKSRENFREALVQYLGKFKADLSPDSQMRLEKNPLRILDSKDSKDQEILKSAPSMDQFMSEESKNFFTSVQKGLATLQIPYKVNSQLVRGLDYYCHTVFEFVTTQLGAQGTILAGGRYDGLIESMGGPATPGVGWAAGIERLIELLPAAKHPVSTKAIAVVPADTEGEVQASAVALSLREQGYKVEILWNGNFGKKMKKANALGVTHALILGATELSQKQVALKNFSTGEQKNVSFEDLKKITFD